MKPKNLEMTIREGGFKIFDSKFTKVKDMDKSYQFFRRKLE